MKRRHKYQLSLNDALRLRTVWQVRITWLRALALLLVVLVIATALAVAVIVTTPLRTYLPGYMKQDQRSDAMEAMMMVDSLQERYRLNQAYLDNLMHIIDTERVGNDSTLAIGTPVALGDTLMTASAAERRFVRDMEEREKFNISITAPLAAEGMIFTMPAEGAIVSADTKHSETATVVLPRGADIDAISDGAVIDKHYDLKTRTYTIVVQHAKGFVSQYSHAGQPVVDCGETVTAGQRIARQAEGVKDPELLYLQIWRNGLPLVSASYLRGYISVNAEEKPAEGPTPGSGGKETQGREPRPQSGRAQ